MSECQGEGATHFACACMIAKERVQRQALEKIEKLSSGGPFFAGSRVKEVFEICRAALRFSQTNQTEAPSEEPY